jgi:hypothetical protein
MLRCCGGARCTFWRGAGLLLKKSNDDPMLITSRCPDEPLPYPDAPGDDAGSDGRPKPNGGSTGVIGIMISLYGRCSMNGFVSTYGFCSTVGLVSTYLRGSTYGVISNSDCVLLAAVVFGDTSATLLDADEYSLMLRDE